MSLQVCDGGNSGFPLLLNQNLFTAWPGVDPAVNDTLQKLIVPTDVEIAWAPSTSVMINATNTNELFQIGGFDVAANGTTLTLGGANYTCSKTLTLCRVQHPRLSTGTVTNELILTFVIQNKNDNPSSPDVVLLCRPVVLTDDASKSTTFWKSVNSSVKQKAPLQVTGFDLSSLFAHSRDVMMPVISYETCIATRLIGGPNRPREGSTKARVLVCSQPMNVYAESDGTQKCSNISKYTLPEGDANLLLSVFSLAGDDNHTKIQFTTGKTDSGTNNAFPTIPSRPAHFLKLGISGRTVDDVENVLQTFEYLVPEVFLGKSFAEIAKAEKAPVVKSKKKAFKCYTIDPRKDVVGDQILVDPTTGKPLSDTMTDLNNSQAGGDPALAAALAGHAVDNSGLQPGDIEAIFVFVISVIAGVSLLSYLFYVLRHFMAHQYHSGISHLVFFCMCLAIVVILKFTLQN